MPCPSPGDLLTQGLNLHLLQCRWSPALQADSLPTGPPGKPQGSLGGYVIEISSHSPEKLTLINKRGPQSHQLEKIHQMGLGPLTERMKSGFQSMSKVKSHKVDSPSGRPWCSGCFPCEEWDQMSMHVRMIVPSGVTLLDLKACICRLFLKDACEIGDNQCPQGREP